MGYIIAVLLCGRWCIDWNEASQATASFEASLTYMDEILEAKTSRDSFKLDDTRTGSVRIAAIHTGSFGYSHMGGMLFAVRGLYKHPRLFKLRYVPSRWVC
jgi:hypothetical protein